MQIRDSAGFTRPMAVVTVSQEASSPVVGIVEETELLTSRELFHSAGDALSYISQNRADVVLLHTSESSPFSPSSVQEFCTQAAGIPVLIIADRLERTLARELLMAGAQDLLQVQDLNPELLAKALTYAVRRNKVVIELETATVAARLSAQVREEFLARVSHELRTPLTTVLGAVDLLADENLSAEGRRLLQLITEAGRQQLSVVNDLLDYSEAVSGSLRISEEELNLREFLQNSLDGLRRQAERLGVLFHVEAAENAPEFIRADRTRLTQILTNLISNALKFTRRGAIIVHARLGDRERNLEFAVIDTGSGMEDPEKALEPFVQLEPFMSRQHRGFGLGLSIVSHIVEQLGGRIEIRSQEQVGTCILVQLPILTPGEGSETAAAAVRSGVLRNEPLSGFRILFAEDNKVNQTVIKRALEKRGAEVLVAENGREALELLDTEQIDCVLMDVQMPELDGIEATRRIRLHHQRRISEIPVLGLTAHAFDETNRRCGEAGMNGVLTKPMSNSELVGKILELAAEAKAQD